MKARRIVANQKNGIYTDFYQSCCSWYEDQAGVDEYFVRLSSSEDTSSQKNATRKAFLDAKKPRRIDDEGYVIYVFDRNIGISKGSPTAGN